MLTSSQGLTPVPVYDVDGKVIYFHNTRKSSSNEKQIPVVCGEPRETSSHQETDSLPETQGESTAVGFSLVGLFMTLLAFLGFVDSVHVITNHYELKKRQLPFFYIS